MKKFIMFASLAILISVIAPTNLKADTQPNTITKTDTKNVDQEKAAVLVLRLEQIKAMDISSMNFSEKRNLRKEVRSIKSQLNDLGGVYISVGAIIIVLLLLILLF